MMHHSTRRISAGLRSVGFIVRTEIRNSAPPGVGVSCQCHLFINTVYQYMLHDTPLAESMAALEIAGRENPVPSDALYEVDRYWIVVTWVFGVVL